MRAQATCTVRFRPPGRLARTIRPSRPLRSVSSKAKKVEIEDLEGTVHVVQVEEGETILEAALDAGVDAPHDCKMGVCMTCPSRLVSGKVDQSAGMLSEDVIAQGYALLCVSSPETDCRVKIIEEEELLNVQLVAGEM
uniref:2Fe-2S ferredoxin-type domain-containing protein n=1 Tax=Picocystis salinarum TaxID=88271 RepID=A0A7S3XDS6_9CHLO